MQIEKRIETATEVITVDSNNVVHVEHRPVLIWSWRKNWRQTTICW